MKRDRGLKHVTTTAKEIMREALPIQCVEAVFLAILLICCTPCLCGRCHEERLDLKTGKYVVDEPGAPLVAPVAEVVARDKEPDIPEAEASVVETAPPEPPAATPSMLLCCDAPKVDLPSRAALAVVCA